MSVGTRELTKPEPRKMGQPQALHGAALGKKFGLLAERWYQETGMMSLMHQKAFYPAYQRIIGMGKDALPFIFRELKRKHGHWLWALNAITGEDPVRPGRNFAEAVDDWLEWGRANGYV
jgi:hypothetical protein